MKGYYALNMSMVDWESFALEVCGGGCYLSFEWVLAKHGILSQQPDALTLATAGRSKKLKTSQKFIICHHLDADLIWGYSREGNILVAQKEKAFLDQAYLSLNGSVIFDISEMDLELLDKKILKKYLAKFNNRRLEKLVGW